MIALLLAAAAVALATAGVLLLAVPRRTVPVSLRLAALLAIWPQAMGIGIYAATGSPGLPASPAAAQAPPFLAWTVAEQGDLRLLIARLGAASGFDPGAGDGTASGIDIVVARAYAEQGRFAEAADAFSRAVSADPDHAALQRDHMMALIAQSRRGVPDGSAALDRFLAMEPADPLAQALRALGYLQSDQPDRAMAVLQLLPRSLGDRAPMRSMLAEQVEAMAAYAGVELSAHVVPTGAVVAAADEDQAAETQPTGQPAQAAALMPLRTLAEQLARRLALQPADVEGWRRLGRARTALGDSLRAREAYANAAALASERADLQLDLARAALWSDALSPAVPASAVAAYRSVLAVAPDNVEALWYLGVAERDGGDGAAARLLWERLLSALPAGTPEHATARQRLDELIGR